MAQYIQDLTDSELREEMDRREHAKRRHLAAYYEGIPDPSEDYTDGDSHIETNGGIFRGERVMAMGRES